MECNVCGGKSFKGRKSRPNIVCLQCGSDERTRVMHLLINRHAIIKPGMRIMHLAPEKGIYSLIKTIPDVEYEAYDMVPKNFPFTNVRQMNLVTDLPHFPSNTYDIIIHSHVMEHIPCNITAVLVGLNRLLKEDGEQLCVIPFVPGHYAEDLGPMPTEQRVRQFGQNDHVRRFGDKDVQTTIGMIFRVPQHYDLCTMVDSAALDKYNIPDYARSGFTPHTVLRLRKSDMILRI